MGKTKGPYNCEFPVGTSVRIASLDSLEKFQREWKYHHKIMTEQLAYHGQIAVVERASVYHGGDELYELKGIPGIWQPEQCFGSLYATILILAFAAKITCSRGSNANSGRLNHYFQNI